MSNTEVAESESKKRKLEGGDAAPSGSEDSYNPEYAENDTNGTEGQADEQQIERLKQLLLPFTKEQLVDMLIELGTQNKSVFDKIEKAAGADPAHRKIFVRGLPWDLTTEQLLDAFREYGDVEEGAVIMDKATGRSRGFGFVTFKDMHGAQKALEDPSKEIGGRRAMCNLAVLRANQSSSSNTQNGAAAAAVNTSSNDITQRKLFIRGLSWDTTVDSLKQVFSQYGNIEDAVITTDRHTGKSKGYGFVTFTESTSAMRALQQPTKMIDGRSTHSNLAVLGQKSSQATGSRSSMSMYGQAGMMPTVAGQYGMGSVQPMAAGSMMPNMSVMQGGMSTATPGVMGATAGVRTNTGYDTSSVYGMQGGQSSYGSGMIQGVQYAQQPTTATAYGRMGQSGQQGYQ